MKSISLSDAVSFVVDNRGRTCPTSATGIPLIATNCIKDDELHPVFEKVRYLTKDTYDNWFRAHPKPGDIIFVLKGTPGRVALTPDPVSFCIAQDMVALRPDSSKIYPRYLFAALRSRLVQSRIEQMHVGSLIPHFKKGEFKRLVIPLPDRSNQIAIGDFYFELSKKIELNRRMSETLEKTALMLFKSWFVNFNPIEARRPNGSKLTFSATIAETEIGPAPDGWPIAAISDVAICIKGKSYRSEDLRPSTTALITLKSFGRGGGYRPDGLKAYAGDCKSDQVVRPEELVVSCTDVTQSADVIGRPALVLPSRRYERLVASLDVLVVRSKDARVSVPFLYCLLKEPRFTNHTYAHTSGTTVLHLAVDSVGAYRFPLPDGSLVEAFTSITAPCFRRIAQLYAESELLAELRDIVLPALMSERYSMKDASRDLEAIA